MGLEEATHQHSGKEKMWKFCNTDGIANSAAPPSFFTERSK